MHQTIIAIFMCLLTCIHLFADPPSSEYKLVWFDEFDGKMLDSAKWSYRLGPRRKAVNTIECAKLDGNGYLVLTTRKNGELYETAMIHTQGKFESAYGYYECRVKFQTQEGHWSAFWLQSSKIHDAGKPKTCGTEIDIFEILGNQRDTLLSNLHWYGYGDKHRTIGNKYSDKTLEEGFHVIGLEWTPANYVIYLDGKEIWRTEIAISHIKQYLILSLEVDAWGGDIAKAVLPDSLIVDYIRVYQKKDAK